MRTKPWEFRERTSAAEKKALHQAYREGTSLKILSEISGLRIKYLKEFLTNPHWRTLSIFRGPVKKQRKGRLNRNSRLSGPKRFRERWAPSTIPYHSVSNEGRVRREIHRSKIPPHRLVQKKILRTELMRGHLYVVLYNSWGRKYRRSLKHLIADAFIPPAGQGRVINVDGDPMNCALRNLRRIIKGRKLRRLLTAEEIDFIITEIKRGERGAQEQLARRLRVDPRTINYHWRKYVRKLDRNHYQS